MLGKFRLRQPFDFALRGSRTFITVTFFYSIIILYLMFFGFGRIGAAQHTDGYTFMWVPDSVFSFRFPRASDLDFFMLCLFDFGNLAAFIPFGILIPLLFRVKFFRFPRSRWRQRKNNGFRRRHGNT